MRTRLGCQVESEKAVVAQRVLHQKWDLIAEAELHRLAQAAGLAEVCEVLERESQSNGLGQVDFDIVLLLVDVCVGTKSD